MQHPLFLRIPCVDLLIIVTAIALGVGGCASRTYRADRLPPEFVAPVALDLDTMNLSGLANNSVSVEVIQPGDVLEISMVTDYAKLDTSTTPIRVSDDGMVVVPLVGKVSVGGMEVERAEQAINAESIVRGIFRNPCITVTMKQCRTQKVTVVGAVNAPGCHQLPRGASSLLAAINAAGGLSKEAGTEIEIRHTDSREASTQQPQASSVANNSDGSDKSVQLASFEQTIPNTGLGMTKIDLQAAAAGSIRVPDLHDGDVVNVARRKLPSVYVLGLVRKPGEIKFPTNQELRMLDALAMAGGVSNPVAEEVLVIRKVQNSPDPVRISVSIQDAKNGNENIALAPGDMVTVEQTPATVAIDIVQTVVRFSVGGSLNWF